VDDDDAQYRSNVLELMRQLASRVPAVPARQLDAVHGREAGDCGAGGASR